MSCRNTAAHSSWLYYWWSSTMPGICLWMLVQCWYKKLRIAIYRHFKQLFAAGQRLPWQIKSTLIISKILPVRARFAAQCRTLRTAPREHILPKNRAKIRKCGKSRQIADVIRSKNVVETGVFYYRCPCVTLGDLECVGVRGWSTNR
jgi:hypothetical protein